MSTAFLNNSKMASGMSGPESAPESPVTTRQYGISEWADFRNRGFCFALSQTCFSLTERTALNLVCQLITLTRNVLATSKNALSSFCIHFLDKIFWFSSLYVANIQTWGVLFGGGFACELVCISFSGLFNKFDQIPNSQNWLRFQDFHFTDWCLTSIMVHSIIKRHYV